MCKAQEIFIVYYIVHRTRYEVLTVLRAHSLNICRCVVFIVVGKIARYRGAGRRESEWVRVAKTESESQAIRWWLSFYYHHFKALTHIHNFHLMQLFNVVQAFWTTSIVIVKSSPLIYLRCYIGESVARECHFGIRSENAIQQMELFCSFGFSFIFICA